MNNEAAVSASDALSAQYRALLLECSGQDPQKHLTAVQTALSKNPTLSSKLTGAQTHAWQAIETASLGHAKLAWDSQRKTPSRIEPYVQFRGKNGAAARADFDARLFGAVKSTLGYRNGDSLVAVDQRDYENKSHDTATETTRVARYRYERRHAGLKVFGDYLDIALRTSDWDKSAWFVFVNARWARDLPVSLAPKKMPNVAINAALVSGEVSEGTSVFPPELGLCDLKPPAKLCYRLELNNTAGDHWGYFVDADSGAVLQKGDRIKHQHSGSLKTYVGRPHEGNSKYLRPIPRLDIYEDPKTYLQESACYVTSPLDRTRGDETVKLGETDYDGNYIASSIEPGDTTWTVDFRGPWVKDNSRESDLTIGTVIANTNVIVPQTTLHHRSRRAEAFYLLNYAATIYDAANVVQFKPVPVDTYLSSAGYATCQNPASWSQVQGCVVGTTSATGCVEVIADDLGITAHPTVERRFRQTATHEHGHSLQDKAGVVWAGCSGDCDMGTESLADLDGLVATQFETNRQRYRPDTRYPETPGNYSGELTAIHTHLLKHIGVVGSVYRTHDYLYAWNGSTKMLGTCTDQNSDGYVVPGECPSNSFYLHVLNADTSGYTGISRAQYEISEVHASHISDADPDNPGVQSVPWADELPNGYQNPPLVDLESGGSAHLTCGTEPNSPLPLAFQYVGDHHAVMFLGRAGEGYDLETWNLSAGTDTILEVVDRVTGQVLASNDDCIPGSSLFSCIAFWPTETDYYVLRAKAYPNSSTGPLATYDLRLYHAGDDYGDDLEAASPLAPAGTFVTAELDHSNDEDVFRLASGNDQTLTYLACSDSGFGVESEILDESENVIDTLSAADCSESPGQVDLTRGTYFLRVKPDTSTVGTYKVKATLGEDIDQGTHQSAWELPDEENGYVLASRFESAGDEDWYSYTTSVSGRWLLFEVFDATATPEIEVYAPATTVYGRTGTLDALPDTSGGAGLGHFMLKKSNNGFVFGQGARLGVIAIYPGTYYFRVRNTSGASGSYSLMFDDSGLQSGWSQLPFPE